MRGQSHRLETLEAAMWRREAARALARASAPYTVDEVLTQCVRFLSMPPEVRQRDYPMFTLAELCEMETWLPAIRGALLR
jgi:hypothetical protein